MDGPLALTRGTFSCIRVVIIAQVRLYRDGLALALSSCKTLEVVGVSNAGQDGIAAALRTCADVVLLDMGMPDTSTLIRSVLSGSSGIKIVGLGISECEK